MWRGVVALGAIGATWASIAPARAESSARASAQAVTSLCREDGVDLRGQIDLLLPAGSTVRHSYRVFNATRTQPLGTDETPVPALVKTTIAFSDPQYFGGAWTDGLPFTYEQTTQVLVLDASGSSSSAYTQIIAVSCADAGAKGIVSITEPVGAAPSTSTATTNLAPAPVAAAVATPVAAQPRFAG